MRIYSHFCHTGQVNTYLIAEKDEKGSPALIVDPADIDKALIKIIEGWSYDIIGILVTHDHEQHVRGLGKIQKIYPCPVYAYKAEIQGMKTVVLRETYGYEIGPFKLDVLHVPGHSNDSLVFRIGYAYFTGDTLHAGRISSVPSMAKRLTLVNNIRAKILCGADNHLILPGHGCPSKIRIEKMFNHDMLESGVELEVNLF